MRTVLLVSLLVSLAACGDDAMSVHGRLLLPDGTPARGYEVSLDFRDLTKPGKPVVTDDEGRYEVSHAPPDIPAYAHPLVQFVRPEDRSVVATLSHNLGAGDFPAPDVRLWDAALVATGSEGDTALSWQVSSDLEGSTFHVVAYEDDSIFSLHGSVLWSAEAGPSGFLLPARVIEDHPALVTVYAGKPIGDFYLWLATSDVAVARSALVSLARGASCTVGNEHGDEPLLDRDHGQACPLTDGRASSQWPDHCSSVCQDPRHVTIDLGAPMLISSVVLHGFSLAGWIYPVPRDVEVSSDGSSYMAVGSFDTPGLDTWTIVDLAEPTEARFVRVSTDDRSSISDLAELSVF